MVIPMAKILQKEAYKFFKSRKNRIVMAVFMAVVVLLLSYHHNEEKKYMDSQHQYYSAMKSRSESMYAQTRNILSSESITLTSLERQQYELELEYYNVEKNQLAVIEYIYSNHESSDLTRILIAENKYYNNILEAIEKGIIPPTELTQRNMNLEKIEKQMTYNQYLLDNDIEPMINPYTITGANALVLLLRGNNLLILVGLLALLSMDVYLSEIEEGSYKLSFSQPFKRSKTITIKLIVVLLSTLLLIAFGVGITYGVATFMGGTGDWNYPIITRANIETISFNSTVLEPIVIPLWKYVLMGVILFLLAAFFMIALAVFTSILTDSMSLTTGVVLIALVLAFLFNNIMNGMVISNLYYPFSYFYTENVLSVLTWSSYYLGVIINGIGILIFVILTYHTFIKKDFLGAKE